MKFIRFVFPVLMISFSMSAVAQDTTRLPNDMRPGVMKSRGHNDQENPGRVAKGGGQRQAKLQHHPVLMQSREIDNQTKYQLIKDNLTNASETYYLLNKKIIDLKSRTTTNNLDVFITSLNNPESKELGFSLSDRIVDLVEKIVLQGKADKNDRNGGIIESTKSIINARSLKVLRR
ncbi:hypothetical protein MKQ70_00120 [Chitinophaga sedimenti]|uniref:hypothetical protein n=1 Tax=Chitinophaga sedimenti TaxID=2033606 RepID=UPI002004C21B|nr:hypothetical protein [Chitinophaga sedimenti]MCK7553492.1 hypothetical protein [Chitinophaga sedimenti]